MPRLTDRIRNGYNAMFDRGRQSPYQESGVPGYQVYGGYVTRNERNPKLVGQQRYVEAQEILTNISIIAASVRYFLNLVAKPTWKVEPANESSEAQAVADFVDEIMQGMGTNWSRNVRRSGMYKYHGFGVHEWVAKKRDDGKIILADIEPRPWHTVERWDIDAYGNVQGVEQHDRQTGGRFYIPRSKIIYFVDDLFTDNPEGQGWFRSLVEPADRMRAYLNIEQLGFQRDMSGIPVGRAPLQELQAMIGQPKRDGSGVFTAADVSAYLTGLQNFIQMQVKQENTSLLLDSATYRDTGADGTKTTSVMKWGLDILTGKAESMPEMGKAIERLTYEMARIMGTESILIGSGDTGSLALSKDKSQNLYLMVNATIADMAECYERDMVGPICKMNGIDESLWPKLEAEDVAFRDVEAVAATLRDMATAGAVLAPDDPAIDDVRDMLGIARYEGPPPEPLAKPTGNTDEPTDPDDGGDDPLEKLKITIDIDEGNDDFRNQAAELAGPHGIVKLDHPSGGYAMVMGTISPNLFLLHRYDAQGIRMGEVQHSSKVDAIEEALRCGYVRNVQKYDPDQPRDPGGENGGQWISSGGSGKPDVIFEVAPNPDDKDLSDRWDSLTDEQKAEITKAIAEDVTPKVLSELGVEGKLQSAMGGFEGKINPSLVLNVSDNPFEAAGILGEALSQKSMVVAADKPGAGLERLGMIGIGVSSASELASVQDKIVDLADGFTYRDGEMQFLNFTDLSDTDFANQINDRLGNSYRIRQSEIYSNLLEESEYASGKGASKGNARREFRDSLKSDVSRALDAALKGFGKSEFGQGAASILAAIQGRLEALEKKYNPNQPRDPAGTPTGGRWTPAVGGRGKVVAATQATKKTMFEGQEGKTDDEVLAMAAENQEKLSEIGKELAAKLGTTWDDPGVKKRASAERKVATEGYESMARISDLSRGTFVVDSLDDADGVIRELSKTSTVYDKGWRELTESGYLDRKIYVQFPNGGLSEIQLVPRGIHEIKMGEGHKLYEVARDPGVPLSTRMAAVQRSLELYVPATKGTEFDQFREGK